MTSRPFPLSKARIALCTVCTDRFVPGLEVTLASLRENLAIWDLCEVRVFYSSAFARLSHEAQRRIHANFPGVNFIDCAHRDFHDASIEYEAHRPAFLILEAFLQTDVDRVIFIDSDTLCLADFSELAHFDVDFAGVECRNWTGGRYNSGFMVIGARLLSKEVYDAIAGLASKEMAYWIDQPLINAYLESRADLRILTLPALYNFVYMGGHPDIGDDRHFLGHRGEIKIVHWAGRENKRPKPWDAPVGLSLADDLWRVCADRLQQNIGSSVAE